jgi:hypothetical protein
VNFHVSTSVLRQSGNSLMSFYPNADWLTGCDTTGG